MGQTSDPLAGLLRSLLEQHGATLPALELAELLWLAQRLPSEEAEKAIARQSPAAAEPLEGLGKPGAAPVVPASPQPAAERSSPDPLPPSLPTFFPPEPPRDPAKPSSAALLPDQALPTEADVEALLPLRVQDVRLISDPRPLQAALAPLEGGDHWLAVPVSRPILDERATVDTYARTQRLWPTYTLPREPRLSLVLLVDGGLSMQAWQRLAGEVEEMLAGSDAFRDVRAVRLDPDRPATALAGLAGGGDEQVVLLLSDCSGTHWWRGARMHKLLKDLSSHVPFAILQVLPDWMWRRTALGIGAMVALRNRQPFAVNRLYEWRALRPWEPSPPQGEGAFVVPLLSLDAACLSAWSCLVLGQGGEAVTGVCLPATWPTIQITPRVDEGTEAVEDQARRRLRTFFQRSTASAERLLRVMAAAPVLTLPVMRLLQLAMVRERGPLGLAELLLSGFLRRVEGSAGDASSKRVGQRQADRIQFELEPAVRSALRAMLPGPETAEVVQLVSELIEHRWDQCDGVPPFQAFLADPSLLAEGHPLASMVAFAEMTAEIIARIPGPAYQRLAQKLRQGAGLEAPDPFPPESFAFEEIGVEAAVLQRIPGAEESFPFTTAQVEHIPWIEFVFQTARLVTGSPQFSNGRARGFKEQLRRGSQMDAEAVSLPTASLPEATGSVSCLTVLDDGRLASGTADSVIRLWDPATLTCQATLTGHDGPVTALIALPHGCLGSGSADNTIRLWDLATATCTAVFHGHQSWVIALASLGDGRLASGSIDTTIRLWDPATGSCTAVFKGHQDWVKTLVMLVDGRLASGSFDRTIRLWDLSTGTCSSVLNGHKDWVTALTVLSDGRLVSCSDDRTIRLWDPASGSCSAVLERHPYGARALALLSDGRLASGSWDSAIRVWDPATWTCTATLEGHQDTVSTLVALGDGLLVSGSRDNTIRLWDAKDGTRSRIDCLDLLHIPPGSYQMGSPPDEPERFDDEGPQHEVRLETFFLSRTPITQAQWRAVALWEPGADEDPWPVALDPDPVAKLKDAERFRGDQRPVVNVSWHEAMAYCHRLRVRTGKHYTLPSEAQWEYACRAGTTTPFHFGDTLTTELANYDGNSSYGQSETEAPEVVSGEDMPGEVISEAAELAETKQAEGEQAEESLLEGMSREGTLLEPARARGSATGLGVGRSEQSKYRQQTTDVALFPANAWGLHDMHGNVLEWCADHWHDNYKGAPADGCPWVDEKAEDESRRLLRGGSWLYPPRLCRSAYRFGFHPVDRDFLVGFRVCCLPQDLILYT